MENCKLISIIVPIYNVELYLSQCIESLIAQTYKNLEIILVDDGSTDDSLSICNYYASRDSRIKVIHKENGGQSSARNIGLEYAQGEYVAFVDSDDWVNKEMYEKLHFALVETNSDVVTCGIFYEYTDREVSTSTDTDNIEILTLQQYIEQITDPRHNVRFEVWNKLFRSGTIKEYRFRENQLYEEIYFNRMLCKHINRVAKIDASLYHYKIARPGNTNSSFRQEKLEVFNEILDFCSDIHKMGYGIAEQRMICFGMDMCQQLYLASKKFNVDKATVKSIVSAFDDFYKKCICHTALKYHIFRLSPYLYYTLYKLK